MDGFGSPASLNALFSALASEKRRNMVHALALQPATIKQLADANDLSLPAMHKHVRMLEEGRLILRKKVGRTNFVALNKASINLLRDWTLQFRSDWGNDHESLENYIAGLQE